MRRLRWFGHRRSIEDGHLSGDVLYGERTSLSRSVVCPVLSCKDVYNRGIKSSEIDPDSWESFECRMISALSLVLFGRVQRDRRPGGNSCVTTKGTTKRGSCCPTSLGTAYICGNWLEQTVTQELVLSVTLYPTLRSGIWFSGAFHCLSRQKERTIREEGDGCSNYSWSGWSCMYTVMLDRWGEDLVEWEDVTESHFADKWLLTGS